MDSVTGEEVTGLGKVTALLQVAGEEHCATAVLLRRSA